MSRKALRSGYTTGTCAAAASLGAALMLRDGESVESVELMLPMGGKARFDLSGQEVTLRGASCYVVKDAGDDPDVTHGAELHAELCWAARQKDDLELVAGTGIGQVTKPGLAVTVGEPAINPVPRKMITAAVRSVFPQIASGKALRLTLSIPDGETAGGQNPECTAWYHRRIIATRYHRHRPADFPQGLDRYPGSCTRCGTGGAGFGSGALNRADQRTGRSTANAAGRGLRDDGRSHRLLPRCLSSQSGFRR